MQQDKANEYFCSDCNASVDKDDTICKNCGASLADEEPTARFYSTKHRVIFYLLYLAGVLLLMVLFFYFYTTFREMLVKSEYYFDPFRTTIIILASICIATFVFTFLFINGDKKKRIAISISSVFIICIIYFLLPASDTRIQYIAFLSLIIFELETIIFNNMKKYTLLLVLITVLFLIFLGNFLITKVENPDPKLSLMQISLEVDLPQFLDQIASGKDEKFDSLISKLKSIVKQETKKDSFEDLLFAANKQNIDLKKYFNVDGINNEAIIAELRNMLIGNLKQDSATFYSRMLISGSKDIKININNQSNISINLIIDSTRSSLDQICKVLLDTSQVEFRIIRNGEETFSLMKIIEGVLTFDNNKKTKPDSIENEKMTDESFRNKHPLFSIAIIDPTVNTDSTFKVYIKKSDKKTFKSYMDDPQVKKIIPDNQEFLLSTIPIMQIDEEHFFNIFCVNKQPSFYGNMFEDFNYGMNDDSISGYLSFRLKRGVKEKIGDISELIATNFFLIKHVNMVYFSPLKITQVDSLYFHLTGFEMPPEVDYIKTILIYGRKTLPYKIASKSIKQVF